MAFAKAYFAGRVTNLLNKRNIKHLRKQTVRTVTLHYLCLLLGQLKWKSKHDATSQQCLVSTKTLLKPRGDKQIMGIHSLLIRKGFMPNSSPDKTKILNENYVCGLKSNPSEFLTS